MGLLIPFSPGQYAFSGTVTCLKPLNCAKRVKLVYFTLVKYPKIIRGSAMHWRLAGECHQNKLACWAFNSDPSPQLPLVLDVFSRSVLFDCLLGSLMTHPFMGTLP